MRRRLLSNKRGGEFVNGYEFVDLGLSVKWATCNIGARSPEEYGWYFQWAGTIAYNSDRTPVKGGDAIKFGYNSNCPYWVSGIDNYSTKWSKYTNRDDYSSTGIKDNKLILELEDDAAHVHIGGNCRMPTVEEYEELLNACNTEWVEDYNSTGINGRLFTLKSDPTKTLFFSAAGTINDSFWRNAGSEGHYWSSSLGSNEPRSSKLLYFNFGNIYWTANLRYNGRPVRAVLPK